MASQLFYAVAILCALSNGVVGQFTVQSCMTLLPLGGGTPAAGSNFFGIPGGANLEYELGIPINAFLADLSGLNPFQNVIIQARRQGGSTDAVGTFTEQSGLSMLSCPGSAGGTLVDNGNGGTVLNIQWVPDVPVGPISIVATYTDSTGGLFQQTLDIECPTCDPIVFVTIGSCPADSVGSNPVIPDLICRRDGNFFGFASCDPDVFSAGVTTVTCTCEDPLSGQSASCAFQVTVPGGDVITIADCPDNIVEDNPVVPALNLLCSRNSSPFALATCDQPTTFPLGVTRVTCSCQDAGQIAASCFFDVTNGAGVNPCNSDPCDFGEECRVAPLTQAGYTCHSSTGIPCPGVG